MKRKQRGPTATREALLNAAAELFAEHGFEGATVEKISRKAGANRALISYHFQGKRKLYQTLVAEALSQMGARIDEVRNSGAPPERRLGDLIACFQEMARRRPAFPKLMVREALSGGRHLDDRVFQHFLRVYQTLQEILDEGERLGRFRPVSPILTQIGLVGSLLFFYATDTFRVRILRALDRSPDLVNEDEYIRHWKESIIRGLAADPTGGGMLHRDLPPPDPEPRS